MISISDIMTVDPVCLGPEATLVEAGALMRDNRIRHIPIVDDSGALIGLITQRDLLAVASGEKEAHFAREVMRKKIYTVTESSDMRGAALTMQKYKIGSLPVLKDGEVVGIITDSDYVALAINLLEQLEEAEPIEPEEYDELDEVSEFADDDDA